MKNRPDILSDKTKKRTKKTLEDINIKRKNQQKKLKIGWN